MDYTNLIERVRSHMYTRGEFQQSYFWESYPPVPLSLVQAVEAKIGFQLPDLLRELYMAVSNGGFGFYGIMGVAGGFPDQSGGLDIEFLEDVYLGFVDIVNHSPEFYWPDKLLPIEDYGCAIRACLDCAKPQAPVIVFNPNLGGDKLVWGETLFPFMSSFEEYIERWLKGADVVKEFQALYPGKW